MYICLIYICCEVLYLICIHMVAAFRAYFDHIRSLGFEDRPDYEYLRRLFREQFVRKGYSYDCQYDWLPQSSQGSSMRSEQGVGSDPVSNDHSREVFIRNDNVHHENEESSSSNDAGDGL